MSSLDDLKTLLLGPERDELQDLQRRVADPDARAEDVSAVLARSFHLRRNDPALLDSLAQPVDRCIERSVKRNPKVLAEALFPVMGPAIRHYIADALKGLLQSINQTLDHSLSLRGLGWRLQALRSGVPFAEIVLRNTLAFRVEQVFLIKPDTGLLIEHAADPTVVERDSDAVSAMLTAIQDFVRDAFAADEPIDSVDIGGHTVWLHHGPNAYLAAVIRGLPPRAMRERFDEVLEELHRDYGAALRGFSGDREPLQPVVPVLERCLVAELKQDQARRGLSPAFLLALLLLLGLAAWWAHRYWTGQQAERKAVADQTRLEQVFRAEPGYVVTGVQRQGRAYLVHGLRDPLARPVARLLAEAELESGRVAFELRGYQDDAPEFALARAVRRLQPPEGVDLHLDAGAARLVARGVAAEDWRQRAALLAPTVPGIESFDDSQLQSPANPLLSEIRRRLQPPPGVELSLNGGRLTLSGTAPIGWIEAVEPNLAGLSGLNEVRRGGLRAVERDRLAALVEEIESTRVYFVDGAQLGEAQAEVLAGLIESVQGLAELGERLRLRPVLWVIGQTDGTGDPASNLRLGYERAQGVIEHLVAAVPGADIRGRALPTRVYDGRFDLSLRRVEFDVDLQVDPYTGEGVRDGSESQ